MLYLNNDVLSVHLIDPVSDFDRLGPRFCTGGYIYQVDKKDIGPLLAGPYYPAEFPPVSDGQGLPEVFQATLLQDDISDGDPLIIFGVGLIKYHHDIHEMRKKDAVLEFCKWDIELTTESVRMTTVFNHNQWSYKMTRQVSLNENSVKISTKLQNLSNIEMPFRWFAHPFFQPNQNGDCGTFDFKTSLNPNPSFSLSEEGILKMKPDHDWEAGHYELVNDVSGIIMDARIYHPSGQSISMKGDFPMLKLALWANKRTFSTEPFFEKTLLPEEEAAWSLVYDF